MVHQIGLFIHMISLIIVGGGSVGSLIIERQLWIKAAERSLDARVLLAPLKSTKNFIVAGILLFLISGFLMLGAAHWVFFTQGWFIAKFCLFLTLPARGALVAKPLMIQIDRQLSLDRPNAAILLILKKRMARFHLIQYLIVTVIIFLVIFKI